jgi:hypothetical protein
MDQGIFGQDQEWLIPSALKRNIGGPETTSIASSIKR